MLPYLSNGSNQELQPAPGTFLPQNAPPSCQKPSSTGEFLLRPPDENGNEAGQTSFPSRLHFWPSGLEPRSNSGSLNPEVPLAPAASSSKKNRWTSQTGTSVYQADPCLPWVSSSQGLHFGEGTRPNTPPSPPASVSDILDLNIRPQQKSHPETSLHHANSLISLVNSFQGCHLEEQPRLDNDIPPASASDFSDLNTRPQQQSYQETPLQHASSLASLVNSFQGCHLGEGPHLKNYSPPDSVSDFLDLDATSQQSHPGTTLHHASSLLPLVSSSQNLPLEEKTRPVNLHSSPGSASDFPNLDTFAQMPPHPGTSLYDAGPFLPLLSSSQGLHFGEAPRPASHHSPPLSDSDFLDLDSMPQLQSHPGIPFHHASSLLPLLSSSRAFYLRDGHGLASHHSPPVSASDFLGLNTIAQLPPHPRTSFPNWSPFLPMPSSSKNLYFQEGPGSATLHSFPNSASQFPDLCTMPQLPSHTGTSLYHASSGFPFPSPSQDLHFGEGPRLANPHCPVGPASDFLNLNIMPQLQTPAGIAFHHPGAHLPLASSSGVLYLGNGHRPTDFHSFAGSASPFLDLDIMPQLQSFPTTSLHYAGPHLPVVSNSQDFCIGEPPRPTNPHCPAVSASEFLDFDTLLQLQSPQHPGTSLHHTSPSLPSMKPSQGFHLGEEPRRVNFHSSPGHASELLTLDTLPQEHSHPGTSFCHPASYVPLVSSSQGFHARDEPRPLNPNSSSDTASDSARLYTVPHPKTHPGPHLPVVSASQSRPDKETPRSANLHRPPVSASEYLYLDTLPQLQSQLYPGTSLHHAGPHLSLMNSSGSLHYGEEPRQANLHPLPGPASQFLDMDIMPWLQSHFGTSLFHPGPHLPLVSSSQGLHLGERSRPTDLRSPSGSGSAFRDMDSRPQLQTQLHPGTSLHPDSPHLPPVKSSLSLHLGKEPRPTNLRSAPDSLELNIMPEVQSPPGTSLHPLGPHLPLERSSPGPHFEEETEPAHLHSLPGSASNFLDLATMYHLHSHPGNSLYHLYPHLPLMNPSQGLHSGETPRPANLHCPAVSASDFLALNTVPQPESQLRPGTSLHHLSAHLQLVNPWGICFGEGPRPANLHPFPGSAPDLPDLDTVPQEQSHPGTSLPSRPRFSKR
ncbi:uncharacterized protein LOC130456152 isoform X2 [Monodelphis domestica]|nr:uncharacterized protein LOC130456152 isoform X2 [Monodelphis domestica]